jgi:hypothetical protein
MSHIGKVIYNYTELAVLEIHPLFTVEKSQLGRRILKIKENKKSHEMVTCLRFSQW